MMDQDGHPRCACRCLSLCVYVCPLEQHSPKKALPRTLCLTVHYYCYTAAVSTNSNCAGVNRKTMARGQGKRERNRGQQAKMLQAVLLGAAVGSTSAFVPSTTPTLGSSAAGGAASAVSSGAAAGSSSVRAMSNWGSVAAPKRSFRSRAVEAHGLQMVSAGIEKGMFTTSNPDDRRVLPESRDGKAYFKVWLRCVGCRWDRAETQRGEKTDCL